MRDTLLNLFDERIKPQIAELGNRKLSICRLAFLGLGNAEIGLELGIKEKTVKFHITDILKALNISRTREMCAKLTYLGLRYEEFLKVQALEEAAAAQMRKYKELQAILPHSRRS